MSETKQFTFRLNEEGGESFRQYCEENHLTAAQGFDHLMSKLADDVVSQKSEQKFKRHIEEKEKIIAELLEMLVEHRAEIKKLKTQIDKI